jgi:hypothetical protein
MITSNFLMTELIPERQPKTVSTESTRVQPGPKKGSDVSQTLVRPLI